MLRRFGRFEQFGFTLLELMTVIVVIGILSLMLLASVAAVRGKAMRANCVNNLKSLYTAATAYLTDHQSWPQIGNTDLESPEFARAWVAVYQPYKLVAKNWVCPAVQRALGDPEIDHADPRLDYIPTQFDAEASTPMLWPRHPWFLERADVHGDGNLLIMTNGQIHSISELRPKKRP